MENERYIKIYSHSLASLIAENVAHPPGTTGSFCSIIYIRNRLTLVVEGFYGQGFFFEEDSAEERMWRLGEVIDIMMKALKKSDTFKAGNYEVCNHLTVKWEQVKL